MEGSRLKPGEKQALRNDIDFVSITGMGYVDDMLHIQTWWASSVGNHGYFTAHTADGQEVYASNAYFIWTLTAHRFRPYGEDADRQQYIEYVFDISPEELAQCQFSATLFADNCYTEGNWKVRHSR